MSEQKEKPRVRLIGTDGNAFAVIAKVTSALKKARYTSEEVKAYQQAAMSGDYNHLLRTTMEWVEVY